VCRCGLGGWRNGLRFDPFKKYGDWSYVDIMLDPLVNALRSAMTKQTAVSTAPCELSTPAPHVRSPTPQVTALRSAVMEVSTSNNLSCSCLPSGLRDV
jgi:hypothetical protein